ncbi:Protein of unknown function [Gryllus bimaculatus]|nr:Protein of unknown function [Gryllus bimaculatus]
MANISKSKGPKSRALGARPRGLSLKPLEDIRVCVAKGRSINDGLWAATDSVSGAATANIGAARSISFLVNAGGERTAWAMGDAAIGDAPPDHAPPAPPRAPLPAANALAAAPPRPGRRAPASIKMLENSFIMWRWLADREWSTLTRFEKNPKKHIKG